MRMRSGCVIIFGALAGLIFGCSESQVGITGAGTGGIELCPLLTCDDDNDCTHDYCDETDPHFCVFLSEAPGSPCRGGFCDGEGACLDCPDTECTRARYDHTDPGLCRWVDAPEGTPCHDTRGYCDGRGTCTDCDDGDECTYGLYTGICILLNKPEGAPCDCGYLACKSCDGWGNCVCTKDEQCQTECMTGRVCAQDGGTCGGGEPMPEYTRCHGDWICDGIGNCIRCTTDEQCDDYNECTTGVCDPESGRCEAPVPIADGMPCTGGACREGLCVPSSSVLPCTEQGIRNAIAAGGGPYTFGCNGPQTIVTETPLVIEKDITLDGEGKLTLDGNLHHPVFEAWSGQIELRNLVVTGGVDAGVENGTPLVLNNVTVSHNGGRGIDNFGRITMVNSTVSENTGPGVENFYWLTIRDSTISGNGGDGIGNRMGPLVLVNSTVTNNEGSGVCCDGRFTIVNSTISANLENGVANQAPTTTNYLNNSTVSGNQGPALVKDGGLATITNSLIDGECMGSGSMISDGHNIESPGDSCGFDQGTDQPGVSADELKLGPLQDNGGPTLTHALLPGSVAIDRIPEAMCIDAYDNPITQDQRGVERPQGDACDTGAFELEQP
jgi:hypothetical protein